MYKKTHIKIILHKIRVSLLISLQEIHEKPTKNIEKFVSKFVTNKRWMSTTHVMVIITDGVYQPSITYGWDFLQILIKIYQ